MVTKRELEENAVENQDYDPFSPENVGAVQLITLMRIYDVLLDMHFASDPQAAKELMDLHASGKLMGPLPSLDLSVPDSQERSDESEEPMPPA